MNTGCLSNDDGEGNENEFIAVNSLKIANIGELPYGVLGTAPNFRLREEFNFSYVYVPQQRHKKKFMVVFVQVVKKACWTFKICF